jgi:hypothetical protein
MTTTTPSLNRNYWTAAVIGLLAALFVLAVLGGVALPLVTSDKIAVLVLGIVGLVMCTLAGSGPTIASKGWSNPFTIVGTVLGILILLIVLGVLLGVQLPLLADDRDAFLAVAGIGLLKVLINGLSRLAA